MCTHDVLGHTCVLVSDSQGETLARSHMHPCGAHSIGKQESRQAKWSHTLVSTAVTPNIHVLEVTLYNYRRGSRPLQGVNQWVCRWLQLTTWRTEMKERKKRQRRWHTNEENQENYVGKGGMRPLIADGVYWGQKQEERTLSCPRSPNSAWTFTFFLKLASYTHR